MISGRQRDFDREIARKVRWRGHLQERAMPAIAPMGRS